MKLSESEDNEPFSSQIKTFTELITTIQSFESTKMSFIHNKAHLMCSFSQIYIRYKRDSLN
jgi:hypothetical protein